MKRKISISKSPRKRQRKINHNNAFIQMNNRVMHAIPAQNHTFMNIMQQYYRTNPRMLYRYQTRFEMPTRNTINRMATIYQTHEALKKKNGHGKTKNTAIVLSF